VRLAPELAPRGGGEFRIFGFALYDGWLWTPSGGWPSYGPFALDLHYRRDLRSADIASRSIDEIRRLGAGSPEQHARWQAAMARLFPDIRRGDRMTGVYTPRGAARYFHNGRMIGEIDDPEFARAFFGIWLDPRTSRADFRDLLLGSR
jgi:hypothetical protein